MCHFDGLGMLGILGLVGVDAQNHGAVFLCCDLPKAGIGIVPPFPKTQKIDFQRHCTFLCSTAQAADLLPIYLLTALEIRKIRMGNLGEQTRVHGIDGLIAVLPQAGFVRGGTCRANAL